MLLSSYLLHFLNVLSANVLPTIFALFVVVIFPHPQHHSYWMLQWTYLFHCSLEVSPYQTLPLLLLENKNKGGISNKSFLFFFIFVFFYLQWGGGYVLPFSFGIGRTISLNGYGISWSLNLFLRISSLVSAQSPSNSFNVRYMYI